MTSKRKDYIPWNDYFMDIARLTAKRSKDPVKQVGACIVGENNVVLGTGYNGFPKGCSDDVFPWSKSEKNLYVIHAETNAIINSPHNLQGATIYTTLFPCNECAKLIIQKGIKCVIYLEKKNGERFDASNRMFDFVGIKIHQFI